MITGLELSGPAPNLGKGERLDTELGTNANDLINHSQVMETPQDPLNNGVQGACGWVNTSRNWEGDAPSEGMEAPHTGPIHLLYLAVSELYPL